MNNIVWTIVLYFGSIALILFSFIIIIAPERFKKGKKYDERQIVFRNIAYKYSFCFMVLYFTACSFLEMFQIKWAFVTVMLFIGILGSITIFVTICILKDAYNDCFSRKNRPYYFMFSTLSGGGIYLGSFLFMYVCCKCYIIMLSYELLPSGYKWFSWLITILHLF